MNHTKEQDEERDEGQTKTILVVDDEKNITITIGEVLRLEGYTVVTACGGTEGLYEFEKVKADLVVTDLHMEDGDGLALIEGIRQRNRSVPIIVLTGFAAVESAIAAFRYGANEYLTKPCVISELLGIVERFIKGVTLEQEISRLGSLVSALKIENHYLRELKDSDSRNRRQLKEFCGAIAHALKGEFLHIGNSVKTLRELSDASPDIEEEHDVIGRSVEYSQLLLRRLMNYLEIGKPYVEAVQVKALIERTESLIRPRLSSQLRLEIEVKQNASERAIRTDAEQLIGVLIELVNNASKVLREKGGVIKLTAEARDRMVAISVSDTGPGIPAEIRELLLKQQVPSKKGLGLGLFLSGKVIDALGGELRLEEPSDGGASFTILLPTVEERGPRDAN